MPRKKESDRTRVEDALLRRALGFEQEELYSEDLVDKKTGENLETTRVKKVRKQIPPDVRALLFWLKNRCPDRWRDRVEPPREEDEYDFGEDERNL